MKILNFLKRKFLTFFGDIKVFRFPFFIVYDPDQFQITGDDTRDIINHIRPGDLILRKYKHYLDGYFIPGKYSHTGIYVGKGKVIHAVAEGVSYVDLIEFTRCDGIAILRPSHGQKAAIAKAKQFVEDGMPYDFDFKEGNKSLYCHELGAACYSNLRIQKLVPQLLGGLIHSKQLRWLAESFLDSPDFTIVKQYY